MTFGEKLKLLRFEKGLTQDDLGFILGVTKSCISCYENGSRQPSVDILISLSIYFRVSIDFLVGIEPYDLNEHREVRITKKDVELIAEFKKKPLLYRIIIRAIPRAVSRIEEIFM